MVGEEQAAEPAILGSVCCSCSSVTVLMKLGSSFAFSSAATFTPARMGFRAQNLQHEVKSGNVKLGLLCGGGIQ